MQLDPKKVRRVLLAGVVAALAATAAPVAADGCWWTYEHLGLFCNDGGQALVCEWGDDCVMSCGGEPVDVACE